MIILIFGVSNVGKTTTGKLLAEKIHYNFYDLDEEIKQCHQMTLERFIKMYPFKHERDKRKGQILNNLIKSNANHNVVIAVSPIYYASNFNKYLKMENVLSIELQDSCENIFKRLVFSDENDYVYVDEAYKKQHELEYLKDIKKDITYYKAAFKKINNKYCMDGKSPKETVDALFNLYINDDFK